jgi:hypothetical protein
MKRFIFYALDQYTLKVYRRKEWEAGVKHGIACEQQRIIKSLEDYDFSTIWRQVAWSPDAWESFGSDDLIALIKREK